MRSYLSVTWMLKNNPFNTSSLFSVILSYCWLFKVMKQCVKRTIITYANIEAHTQPVTMYLVRVNILTFWPTISTNVYFCTAFPTNQTLFLFAFNQSDCLF